MKKDLKYKIFIGAFLFLYFIVAFISFMHSIQFFNVGNEYWMSVLLGCAYELGQAVVLASILLSENKKSLLTWFLFIILTCVQIIGNVFSVYKFISVSESDYYKYIQEPLLFWIQGINEQTVKVVISWITGALLPVVALGMTGMVASNLQYANNKKDEKEYANDLNQLNNTEIDKDIEIQNNDILPKKEEQRIEVSENTKKDLENVLNSSTNIDENNTLKSPFNLNFKSKE